jgi:hypothetical protein
MNSHAHGTIPSHEAHAPKGWAVWLRNKFLAGLALALPLIITFWILYSIYDLLHGWSKPVLAQIVSLVNELSDQALKVNGGDLGRVEAVLTAQLHVLDGMFATLLRRALAQDTLPQSESHMKFALRAQAQARATAEALALLKNPTVVIARQANIGENVQVNNGVSRPVRAGTHARGEIESGRNELLQDRSGGHAGGQASPAACDAERSRDEVVVGGAGNERAGQDRSDLRRAP